MSTYKASISNKFPSKDAFTLNTCTLNHTLNFVRPDLKTTLVFLFTECKRSIRHDAYLDELVAAAEDERFLVGLRRDVDVHVLPLVLTSR